MQATGQVTTVSQYVADFYGFEYHLLGAHYLFEQDSRQLQVSLYVVHIQGVVAVTTECRTH